MEFLSSSAESFLFISFPSIGKLTRIYQDESLNDIDENELYFLLFWLGLIAKRLGFNSFSFPFGFSFSFFLFN